MEEIARRTYGAVLCDPPMRFQSWSPKGMGRAAERHYATLDDEELAALPIADCSLPNSCLFLWTSGPFLERSLKLMRAWGFTYKTIGFVWLKQDPLILFRDPPMRQGYWTRSGAELCILGTRGRPRRLDQAVRQLVIEPPRQHSRKPDCVHDRIEKLVDGPYLEIFGRRSRKNWTVWGDQARKFDEAAE